MRRPFAILLLAAVALVQPAGTAVAQVAGSSTLGVAVAEMREVALGWSVTKTILHATVYNELGEKVATIDDVIIAPDKSVSYLIIGTGAGPKRHRVAIPVSQMHTENGKLVLTGATRDALRALPAFEYAEKQ